MTTRNNLTLLDVLAVLLSLIMLKLNNGLNSRLAQHGLNALIALILLAFGNRLLLFCLTSPFLLIRKLYLIVSSDRDFRE